MIAVEDMYMRINELLANEFGLSEALSVSESLFASGLLDSMDVLKLIMMLEDEFGIKIPIFEASLDMFDTIESIAELVSKQS